MDLASRARFHGNGFIQIPLNPVTRMHIFDPDFKFDRVKNARIHDHQFWFISQVLIGRIFNKKYEVNRVEDGEHGLYYVHQEQENQPLVKFDMCDIKHIGTDVFEAGEYYRFGGSNVFHDTVAEEFTVTIMTKTSFQPRRPEYFPWVVSLNDEVPDDAFSRQPSIKKMRPYVEKAIEKILLGV